MIQRLVDTRQPERVLEVLEPFLETLRSVLVLEQENCHQHIGYQEMNRESDENNTSNNNNNEEEEEEEVRRLKEVVRVLEGTVAKQESMIRLQQSKIDALVAMIDDDMTSGHGVRSMIENTF